MCRRQPVRERHYWRVTESGLHARIRPSIRLPGPTDRAPSLRRPAEPRGLPANSTCCFFFRHYSHISRSASVSSWLFTLLVHFLGTHCLILERVRSIEVLEEGLRKVFIAGGFFFGQGLKTIKYCRFVYVIQSLRFPESSINIPSTAISFPLHFLLLNQMPYFLIPLVLCLPTLQSYVLPASLKSSYVSEAGHRGENLDRNMRLLTVLTLQQNVSKSEEFWGLPDLPAKHKITSSNHCLRNIFITQYFVTRPRAKVIPNL